MQLNATIILSSLLAALAAAAPQVDAGDVASLAAQVPLCALTCILEAAGAVDCGALDYGCQCAHHAEIQTAVDPCLRKSCSGDDVTKVSTVTTQLCSAVGEQTNTGSGSGSGSGSPAGSGSATTGLLETAPEPTTAAGADGTGAPSAVPTAGAGLAQPGLAMMGAAALAGAWALQL